MSTFKTTSFGTDITDISGSGVERTLEIYDKKVKADISDLILNTDPNRAPFTRIIDQIGAEECTNNKVEWMDQDCRPLSTTLDADNSDVDGSDAGTLLAVSDANLFVANDLVVIIDVSAGTKEIVKIISKESSTTYIVQRAYAGTTALATFADADEVIRLGNVFAENTKSADPDGVEPDWMYNLTQTFKKSVAISRRMNSQIVRGNTKLLLEQLEYRQKEYAEDVELAMMFGQRAYKASSDGETTMGGIEWFLENYGELNVNKRSLADLSMTLSGLNSIANGIFRYGSKKKMAIVSGDIYTKITDWGNAAVVPNDDASDSLGMEIMKVKLAHGELNLVHSRTLDESAVWAKSMFIIDPQYVKKRYLTDSNTHVKMNVQDNDVDGVKHEILGDLSLEIRNPKAHFYFTGIDTSL